MKLLSICAKASAILIASFILVMFIGEGGFWSQPASRPLTTRDIVLLMVMGIYWIGLIIGLRWELWGGLISLVCMIIIILSLEFTHTGGLYFYVMTIPGLLYLLHWYLHRINRVQNQRESD